MQIYLTLLFLFINTVISKAKQQVSAANPEESMRQNIIFRKRWSLFTIIMGTGLIAMFMLPQLSIIYPINHQLLLFVPLVFTIGICIGSIILSITTGQGGSRVLARKASGKPEKSLTVKMTAIGSLVCSILIKTIRRYFWKSASGSAGPITGPTRFRGLSSWSFYFSLSVCQNCWCE